MAKIIARMRGGLGNQLFIIAFAYKLASEVSSKDCQIVLDIREYETYKVRHFELLQLLNNSKIRLYDKKLDYDFKYELTRKIYHVVQKVIPSNYRMNKFFTKRGFFYSKRNSSGYILPCKKNIYLYGYFQDAKMAFSVRTSIVQDIKQLDNSLLTLDKGKKHIAVSIRCGQDYVEQGWPICTNSYFQNAIKEIIDEKMYEENFEVLVFSDVPERVRKMEISKNCKYIENLSSVEQIQLMMQCDDFVISNSSFSWWGAFLGLKSDSIVIMPDLWYDKNNRTEDTLLTYRNVRIRKM